MSCKDALINNIDWVKNMYQCGKSIRFISDEIGSTEKIVSNYLKQVGLFVDKRIPDDEYKSIVVDYQNGMELYKISYKYNRNTCTIIGKLKKDGIFNPVKHRYTPEDINQISKYYTEGNWDLIKESYPHVSKSSINCLMSKHGVKRKNYYWSNDDIEFLKLNYFKMTLSELESYFDYRYSKDAIQTKAYKQFKYSTNNHWNESENNILRTQYSNIPMNELLIKLPNRTKNAIINHAQILGLMSYNKLQQKWTDDEIQFIKNNWLDMTDKEMSDHINRSYRSIKAKRTELKLYRQDKNHKSYQSLSKYLRGQCQDWKNESMKFCGYKCIITGSKEFDIHHSYPVNRIINDMSNKYNIPDKDNIDDYSEEELKEITKIYKSELNLHPLGTCIRKDIHMLYHSIYGKYQIDSEHWNRFICDYKNGKYENMIKN